MALESNLLGISVAGAVRIQFGSMNFEMFRICLSLDDCIDKQSELTLENK